MDIGKDAECSSQIIVHPISIVRFKIKKNLTMMEQHLVIVKMTLCQPACMLNTILILFVLTQTMLPKACMPIKELLIGLEKKEGKNPDAIALI